MKIYAYARPSQAQMAGLDGLSLSKAINWIKNNKKVVIGAAVVAGGVALAAKSAGGLSALGTKAGWVKVGNAITGSSVVQTIKKVNVTSAIDNTAKALSLAAAVKTGGTSDPSALAYGAGNPVNGGGATVAVDDAFDPMTQAPSEGFPTWGILAGLGAATVLVIVMARR